MSEFKISCPSCEQHLALDESYRGLQFACPTCGNNVTVPADPVQAAPIGLRINRATPAAVTSGAAHLYTPRSPLPEPTGKSWLTTFFLASFLGGFGADRFYNGRTRLGILKLLTGGLCGLWSFIDIGLLLMGKYQDAQGICLQPAKRSHLVTALAIMATAILLGGLMVNSAVHQIKSDLATLTGGDPTNGFASPEAVFEAMKSDPDSIQVFLPEERPTIVYMSFLMSRAAVEMQVDGTKKQKAEKAFTALIGKYNLADKLEINSTSSPDEVRTQAGKAFAGVDLVALNADFMAFGKDFSTEHFSISDGDARPVSLRALKIRGNEAKATVISSDETEKPVVFVKSGGSWFLSWEKSQGNPEEAAAMFNSGSMEMSLIVTFDSEASTKRATARSLLAGANHDRSFPAKLETTKSPLQQKLTFFVSDSVRSGPGGMDAVTAAIKKSPGVKEVQHSFAAELKESLESDEFKQAMKAEFAKAIQSAVTNRAVGQTGTLAQPGTSSTASRVGSRNPAPPPTFGANDRWGARVLGFSSQFQQTSWTASQALGKPDTYPAYGDQSTAWASKTSDGQREYLELGFENAAPINQVSIYETLSPGAVDKISVRNPTSGKWVAVWSGRAAPAGNAARIFKVTFPTTSFPVDAIRIDLNSPAVQGWNEIDAVSIALDSAPAGLGSTTQAPARAPRPATSIAASRQALQFDGTNAWLELRPIAWDLLPAFTVEAWVRDWEGALLSQGGVGDPENSFWISLGPAGSRRAYSGWESGRGRNSEYPIGPCPPGRWIHIAMSFDGTNQSFHLDGRLKRRTTAPRPGPFDLRRTLFVGQRAKGQLRSVRVSSVARYRNNFQPAQSWKADAATRLLVQPDQREGTTLKDLSTHGHDAQLHGTKLIQNL
jgi:hypothetical protein